MVARFKLTMFDNVTSFVPSNMSNKMYGRSTSKSVWVGVDEVSRNRQRQMSSMYCEMLSIARAIHLRKRYTMLYDTKQCLHLIWRNYLAYKVLYHILKYSDELTLQSLLKTLGVEDVGGKDWEGNVTVHFLDPSPSDMKGTTQTIDDVPRSFISSVSSDAAALSAVVTGEIEGIYRKKRPHEWEAAVELLANDEICRDS